MQYIKIQPLFAYSAVFLRQVDVRYILQLMLMLIKYENMFQWINPADLLLQFRDGEFNLAPPQVYEVSRLLGHPQLEQLESHARQRATLGHTRWMPIRIKHKDGVVAALPGEYISVGYLNPLHAKFLREHEYIFTFYVIPPH